MKNKTSVFKFTFANPVDEGFPAEVGTVTFSVESSSNVHKMLNETLDFEEEIEAFIKQHICADGGRVVSNAIKDLLVGN